MAKEQKTEVFYCKLDHKEQIFISHADFPNKWICTCCGFTTTTPQKHMKPKLMTTEELFKYYGK